MPLSHSIRHVTQVGSKLHRYGNERTPTIQLATAMKFFQLEKTDYQALTQDYEHKFPHIKLNKKAKERVFFNVFTVFSHCTTKQLSLIALEQKEPN